MLCIRGAGVHAKIIMGAEPSDQEIETKMHSRAWIRECCAKLLALDARLDAIAEGKRLMDELKTFFGRGWQDSSTLNRHACFNTFEHVSHFINEVLKGRIGTDKDMLEKGMAALSKDIQENTYAIWIYYLCMPVTPAIPAATTSNIVAIKRQILLPLNPWAVAYATDPLIRELETLFAKHAAPRMGATALLRLNGELCAL